MKMTPEITFSSFSIRPTSFFKQLLILLSVSVFILKKKCSGEEYALQLKQAFAPEINLCPIWTLFITFAKQNPGYK
jgi:hypothetical protein